MNEMSNPGFRLLPEQASNWAASVDGLFFLLIAVTVFFAGLISAMNIYFGIKYRESKNPKPTQVHGSTPLEIFWSVVPLAISLVIFGWGADIFFKMHDAPANTLDIYTTGKQWMWKIQHPEGKREINELHIPIGQPIKITMTSEDTIHSFFIPDFRVKMDVLPGRYTSIWFEATKPGKYRLYCTEYCGTKHSEMIGWVYAMEPDDYDRWVAGSVSGMTLAEAGKMMFQSLGCETCHNKDSGARGPDLTGRFGRAEMLQTGRTVVMDEDYVRESILNPAAKIVAGYQPLMPTFQGQISEENLMRIIAYIKSIGTAEEAPNEGGAQ